MAQLESAQIGLLYFDTDKEMMIQTGLIRLVLIDTPDVVVVVGES